MEAEMVSKDFNVKAVRVIPLFAGLSDGKLEELRPAFKVTRFGAGEIVVREGDAPDRLFIIIAGEVQVVKNYLEPGAQTIAVMGVPGFFGEMALIGKEGVRSATVVTTEASHFLTLERDAFRKILLANPEIAIALLEDSYGRLRQANELIAHLQKE